MAFSFNRLQKEKQFTFDFSNIKGNYIKLSELVERDSVEFDEHGNSENVYQVHGVFKSDKGNFGTQPNLAIAGTYVNLPTFQLDVVDEILASPEAISKINRGECGMYIKRYYLKGVVRDKSGKSHIVDEAHYKAAFCDINPFDYIDEELDDELENSGNLD